MDDDNMMGVNSEKVLLLTTNLLEKEKRIEMMKNY